MRIEVKPEVKRVVCYKDVRLGDVFRELGEEAIYIKTDDGGYDIETGERIWNTECVVEVLKVHLVIDGVMTADEYMGGED